MLSPHAEILLDEAKKMYKYKVAIINGSGQLDTTAAAKSLPPVDASDLVAYLVLETTLVKAKQLKVHKSLEAIRVQSICHRHYFRDFICRAGSALQLEMALVNNKQLGPLLARVEYFMVFCNVQDCFCRKQS